MAAPPSRLRLKVESVSCSPPGPLTCSEKLNRSTLAVESDARQVGAIFSVRKPVSGGEGAAMFPAASMIVPSKS